MDSNLVVGIARCLVGWTRVALPVFLFALTAQVMAQIANDSRGGFGASALNPALNRGFNDDKPVTAQIEVSASQTPRFDNIDSSTRASRIDMTLLSPGRTAVGPSLGVNSTGGSNLNGGHFNGGAFTSASPSVDVGVHLRHITDDNSRVDVRAWRRLPPNDALSQIQTHDATYGARVDMQLSQVPKSGFIADHGIGMQLESGARITLHRSGGKPMMFYRAKF